MSEYENNNYKEVQFDDVVSMFIIEYLHYMGPNFFDLKQLWGSSIYLSFAILFSQCP